MYKYLPWFLAAAFYGYQYILRVMPSVFMPNITKAYELDPAVFGQLTGVYYIGYSLAHIPIGLAIDKYGPRKVMAMGLFLVLVGTLPFVLAAPWQLALMGRVLTGAGSATAILGCFTVIRLSFPENMFSRILGSTATIGLLGAMYGGKPLGYLMQFYDWRSIIWALLLGGVALMAAIYMLVPAKKDTKAEVIGLDILQKIFANRNVVLISLVGGLMVGPLEGFADVWGIEFLKNVHGVDAASAATMVTLIFLGFAFGAPLVSWVGDTTGRYYLLTKLCALIMGGGLALVTLVTIPYWAYMVLFTFIGVASSYQIFVVFKSTTYMPKEYVGQTSSVCNMIIMIFGYVFHSLIGAIMRNTQGECLSDPSMYSDESYQVALSVLPVAQLVALVLLVVFFRDRQKSKSS